MTIAEQQSLFEAPKPPVDQRILLPEELTALERLEVMNETQGFLPTTRDELNTATAVVAFDDIPGKTARHLNDVLQHQRKARTDMPEQAVRSITAEFAGFAQRARSDHQGLANLQEDIRLLDYPFASLSEEIGDNRAVRQLVRFVDLQAYTKSAGQESPGFDVLKRAARVRGLESARTIIDVYSVDELDPAVKTHIDEVLAGITVGRSRELVAKAVAEQQKRLEFWIKHLQQSRQHSLARPIAERALRDLVGSV